MKRTIFDKIWEAHVVEASNYGPSVLYIDRHYIHEVTSPQAFDSLKKRGLGVRRGDKTFATCDHNVPTLGQNLPLQDPVGAKSIDRLYHNCEENGIQCFRLGDRYNGVVHVIGPELGLTLPGMTIVCGDSHTSTHGAFGSISFGIGTSEVEMVLATQSLLQYKPKSMLIEVSGTLNRGVSAKDLILYIISQLGTSGGTGYFLEFAGEAISGISMEGRMTICNMSIEMGARGALIAPDSTTIDYIKGRVYAPQGADFESLANKWLELKSDSGAVYDKRVAIDASLVRPMVTYGTDPSTATVLDRPLPIHHSLKYMGFTEGEVMLGKPVDYIFLGSCTNGRFEDFRDFALVVKDQKKSPSVVVWLVPGSREVMRKIEESGVGDIIRSAGFELREPGCSACLAMNDDKVPDGKYCLSTSNRNFEGRQGPGARTILCSPFVAAAAAINGVITDPIKYL